ncbi:hypothetical protein GOBAR_DD06059 [Gossypium barbadense]|nr:hypothetical protein GOBAR_DD06059 [Gossypium barbadense]
MNYNTCFHLLLALFIPCSVLCLAMTVRNLNSDQFALLEFKDRIVGPQNVLANNWTASTSVCNWIGVSCGILHKRVIALNLTSVNLRGTIPPHLGNLSFLLSLDLSSNHFYGHLPKELGQLHRLRILQLSYNRLNGEIPSWLGNLERVQRLKMKNNNFTGTIPETLVNMSNLEILNLGFNQLSGQVPSSIFKISSLKAISLSSNSLSGSLPNDMCQHLPKLEGLYLSWNELSGQIPEEIGNLLGLELLNIKAIKGLTGQIPTSIFNITSLKTIDLSNNSLSGSLPSDMCQHLPKLEGLYLSWNELSGSIPFGMGKCNNLKDLSLSYNQFMGIIPRSIGNMTLLEELYLGFNNLEGQIPKEIGNLLGLEMLNIKAIKGLTGQIPTSIFNISSLETIDLSNNSLSGSLPSDMCQHLPKLEVLYLHRNELSGNIPLSMDKCNNLKMLALSVNQFTGIIPRSIGNLTQLERLDLAWNNLEGQIPSSIGECYQLQNLSLGGNQFSGLIPESIFNSTTLQEIDLFDNKLEGNLPPIINAPKLEILLLWTNKLSGNIPNSISNASMLKILSLGDNLFSGPIPKMLASLKHLEVLLIYDNNLITGSATDHEWNFLSSLTNCRNLRKISVSGNPLSGVLPTYIGNLSKSLQYFYAEKCELKGNIPMEIGEIPTKGCFSNFSSTSFMKNSALCGPPRLLVPPCKNDIRKNSQMAILHALRYQSRSTTLPIKDDLLSLKTLRRISHAELSRATNGFEESNMLGSGSFGYVYKGRLSDGMEVAIKVFNLQTEEAFRSFDIECDAIRNIVHRNIVKVITCCSSVDFKALVLDYMPNGNLEKWLHYENCFLDIIQRVDIMIDVAVAIEHLHNGHPTPIIHCDIKPSNILLDEDMVAHVGDFGVAKLLGEGEVMKQTMTLATIGYMAPEFGSAGIVSIKSDVYSYGIILIETFTKKKPTDNFFVEEETIRHWMESSLPKGAIEIADVDLLRREDEYFVVKANCISSIMELALNCSAELPEERKTMKDVVVELKKIKQRLLNNFEHF